TGHVGGSDDASRSSYQLRRPCGFVARWCGEHSAAAARGTLGQLSAAHLYAPFGLVVIGVHAPEFEFGKDAANIDRGIRDHELTYPVAIDNDFAIWGAFGNDAWPAKYLFDHRGRFVRRWIGEGSYDQIEREIRRLLVAAHPDRELPNVSELTLTFANTGQPSYAGI